MYRRFLVIFYTITISLTALYCHNLPESLNSQYYFEDLLKLDFNKPVCVQSPPEDKALYVVEKEGRIYRIDDLENAKKDLYLDFSDKVNAQGESGFLGLAFHPEFAENKTFFVFYTIMEKNQRYQIVSKMIEQPNALSEQILIRQFDEAGNHNGGDLHFGQDGYLYVSLGDEGKANDHFNNSQKIDKDFFSGILRIDVDLKKDNLWPNPHPAIVLDANGKSHYKIPADNPWVNTKIFAGKELKPDQVRSEFFAIGLRNPWRMSFDPKGDLWIGDVGQGNLEEINLIPNGKGGMNFGWKYKEGSQTFMESDHKLTFDAPIYEYGRKGLDTKYLGRSVTGGLVNTSNRIPELKGWYIFSDYVMGNIWALNKTSQGTELKHISHQNNVSAFGQHPVTKEVLAVAMNLGKVLVLKKNKDLIKPIPNTLSETGLFKSLNPITLSNDFIPYQSNLDFWADHAHQKKWFKLPKNTKFGYQKNKPWTSPTGTIWIQHFEVENKRNDPKTKFNVETRILVKTHDGVYGLSYRWNEQQNDATLVDENGEFKSLDLMVNNKPISQNWKFPSRMECMMCHNSVNGFNLGMTNKQLNHDHQSLDKNFISWLFDKKLLNKKPTKKDLDDKFHAIDDEQASVDKRARSYLDVNCAMCHYKNGPTPLPFSMNSDVALKETRLFMKALNHLGNTQRRVIDPGKPKTSVLLNRLRASEGYTKMPFIGNMELDHEAADLIEQWIESLKR